MAETNVPVFQTNSEFAPTTLSSKASEADMDHCAQLIRRAGRFLETGDVEAAEASLRQGLERVPEHPECVAYLAVCLAAGKRKYVTAEKLVTNIRVKGGHQQLPPAQGSGVHHGRDRHIRANPGPQVRRYLGLHYHRRNIRP